MSPGNFGVDEPKAVTTTTPAPPTQPAPPVRTELPAAGNPANGQPRPVPRPVDQQRSFGNTDAWKPEPAAQTNAPTSQPTPPGRYVPRPGAQTSPAVQSEPANTAQPTQRTVENTGASANVENPRNVVPATARPGASTGVVRRSVETVQPSAPPRSPQTVSMPRNSQPSPESSHAHTVVTAPRENNNRQNNHHESKSESKHEEKSDRKQNR